MDSEPMDSTPQDAERPPAATDEAPAPASARAARLRVAVLTGMTVGAVAVTTLGNGPTTVVGITG